MNSTREFVTLVAGIAICFGIVVYLSSCRRTAVVPGSKPGAVEYEQQQYEISRGSNLVAQVAREVEIEADLHLAGRRETKRAVVRLKPGTWLVPEQMYSAGDGGGSVCNDRFCEAVQ